MATNRRQIWIVSQSPRLRGYSTMVWRNPVAPQSSHMDTTSDFQCPREIIA